MLPARAPADRWKLYAFGLSDRSGYASLKQLDFIRALILELCRLDPSSTPKDKRLRGWLEKYARTSDVRFLRPDTAGKVIDGLISYLSKLGFEYRK
jgi:hypothetical protein